MKTSYIVILCIVISGCYISSEQIEKTATLPKVQTLFPTTATTEISFTPTSVESSSTATLPIKTKTLIPTQIAIPSEKTTNQVKNSGSWLLYSTSQSEIGKYIRHYFLWNPSTEESHPLIILENEFISDVSSDGKRALISGENVLSLIDFSTGERQEIIEVDKYVSLAKWWHGNSGVIFLLLINELGEGVGWAGIPAIVDEDGKSIQLLDNNNYWIYPAISPDGQKIAYCRFGPESGFYIFEDGNSLPFDIRSYSYEPPIDHFLCNPSWSSDGRTLAWMARLDENHGAILFDLESNTSTALQKFKGSWGRGGYFPPVTWSPDGRWLTYISFPSDSSESGMWIHDLSNQQEDIPLGGQFPIWHPNSTNIIFQQWNQESKVNESWLVELETWEKRKLNIPENSRDFFWITNEFLSEQFPDLIATSAPIPSFTDAPSQENPVVQIGAFNSLFLRYDPAEWEEFNEYIKNPIINEAGELAESLRHKAIAGCILHDNIGRGTPSNWRGKVSNRQIGNLVYVVGEWINVKTRKFVLVVYQYPEDEMRARIELVIDAKHKLCIEEAEKVLVNSEDLITLSAETRSTKEGEFGQRAVWNSPSNTWGEMQNCLYSNSPSSECIPSIMEKYGASPEAISFSANFGGDFFLVNFEEVGNVDLGVVFYPGRANDNVQGVMLNGSPNLVAAQSISNIDIKAGPGYQALIQRSSNPLLWFTDNQLYAIEPRPDGGQRFLFNYPIYNGCHACGRISDALVAFDFDSQGRFLVYTLLSVDASQP